MLHLLSGGAAVYRGCTCFWVAQRFSAAISGLFSLTALAAEVTLRRGEHFFRGLPVLNKRLGTRKEVS